MSLATAWKIRLLALGGALIVGLIAGRLILPARAASSEVLKPSPAADSPVDSLGVPFPVVVNLLEDPPRVPTDQLDHLGRPITVSGASCHANLTPNVRRRSADEPPMKFHQGLTFHHGDMSCMACHNADNYNTLRLADAAPVAYSEVMSLCAQCHGPQARDWTHGAHGGMMGYWDLARGPRFRKSCIDCHDPHAPAFPRMTPTFKPRDRFLEPRQSSKGGSHE